MNTYKYVAVTHPWQWVCDSCGSDLAPHIVTYHKARVRKSGAAEVFGPVQVQGQYADQEVESTDVEFDEKYAECADCGDEYESRPREGSLADLIRREGVEEIAFEMKPLFNAQIHQFVPGEDGHLYGAADEPLGVLNPRYPGWGAHPLHQDGNKPGLNLVLKNDKLIWKYREGITLNNFRFSKELIDKMTKLYRIISGKEDIQPHQNMDMLISQNLVIWMREDLIANEGSINKDYIKKQLIRYNNIVNWWRVKRVQTIDIPNLGKKHKPGLAHVLLNAAEPAAPPPAPPQL